MRIALALIASVLIVATGSTSQAASGGVQWSPDATNLFVNKDVGAERWSITLNLANLTATGNIFFTDGRSPAFVWCQLRGHNHEPDVSKLTLNYSCYGSNGAIAGFSVEDWTLISDNVPLNASFFGPEPETCDLSGASNGASNQAATSLWECSGTEGPFQFQAFSDGTGFSSNGGAFQFSLTDQGCGFGRVANGAFFNVMYSPSRDLLTLYEADAQVSHFALSECHRRRL